MASSRREYVPVDTTTTLTKRRRLSSLKTCMHSGIDKWNDIFSFDPCTRRRHSIQNRQAQKVHFHPHSTSSRHSSGTVISYRHSYSSTAPLKPILKSSSAYRNSLQTSRTSTSPSIRPAPDSPDPALQQAHEVTLNLLTMQNVQSHIQTFRTHLNHLAHRLTIFHEAEEEQYEARQRQFELQTKYLACLTRQTDSMNELARETTVEVTNLLRVRSEYYSDDSCDEDMDSIPGRTINFEPEDISIGRSIGIMDIDIRHTAVREELEVLSAQMSLETLDRSKLSRGFQKMSRDIKNEIDDVVDEKDTLRGVMRRSRGKTERKEMKKLEERLMGVRRGYIEKSTRIGNGYTAIDEKDFFKR